MFTRIFRRILLALLIISVPCDVDAQILKAVKALVKGGKEGTEKVLKKTAKEGAEESAEKVIKGIVKSGSTKTGRPLSLYKKGDVSIGYRKIAGNIEDLLITVKRPYNRVLSETPGVITYEMRTVLPESLLRGNFSSSVSSNINRLNAIPVPKSIYNISPAVLKKSASKARYGSYREYYRDKIDDIAKACNLTSREQAKLFKEIKENPQYAKQFRNDPYGETLKWKSSELAHTSKYDAIKKRKPITPNNSKVGKWNGEKGNSEYVFNLNVIPSNKKYSNPDGKTFAEMGADLNDKQPSVKFRNNYPNFDKDGGTSDGKPLQVVFDDGISEYINHNEVIKKKGKNISRTKLHEEAFRRLAQQTGKTIDEIKVFKGDLAAAERLAEKWQCSVNEVFARCNNPKRIQRVLHECEDGKTIQLVPRLYHDCVSHDGGIGKVATEILSIHTN